MGILICLFVICLQCHYVALPSKLCGLAFLGTVVLNNWEFTEFLLNVFGDIHCFNFLSDFCILLQYCLLQA